MLKILPYPTTDPPLASYDLLLVYLIQICLFTQPKNKMTLCRGRRKSAKSISINKAPSFYTPKKNSSGASSPATFLKEKSRFIRIYQKRRWKINTLWQEKENEFCFLAKCFLFSFVVLSAHSCHNILLCWVEEAATGLRSEMYSKISIMEAI
ncbi:hypothetical protein JTE90_006896 [Oedothorax gibbosus]|uniref:Uncharacterized protein n=1 Tax=Oedothorax gibbosus TaxID=931172 RepID=A0AAV6VQY5_9ARAC|nr:hypothetical protein JTE90_006896 [Oedothorax gibbosus]